MVVKKLVEQVEHGFYFRMLIIKQLLEIMCVPTQKCL